MASLASHFVPKAYFVLSFHRRQFSSSKIHPANAIEPSPRFHDEFNNLYVCKTPLTEYVTAHKNYLAPYRVRYSRPNKAFAPHRAQKKTRLQSEPPLKVRFLGPILRGSSKRQVLLYSVIPYSFSCKHLSRGTSRLTLTHKRR